MQTNYVTNWQECKEHVLACFPNEACGIVDTNNVFHPYANTSPEPTTNFRIDPKVWLDHDIKAVIHSHAPPRGYMFEIDPRTPSEADMLGQVATDVEWGIVVTEGENVTLPVWWGDYNHRPDLWRREFIHNIQDCLSWISDWYFIEYGVELPQQPREPEWYLHGKDYMSSLYQPWGFTTTVNNDEVQEGDLVMFRMNSDVVNHLGVFLGNGIVGHHMAGKTPRRDKLKIWQKAGLIERIVRLKR